MATAASPRAACTTSAATWRTAPPAAASSSPATAETTPIERDAIAFGEKVLALLDQGAFTATYKYALRLALAREAPALAADRPTALA